jgi:polyisoprenoid-binding protein YceI
MKAPSSKLIGIFSLVIMSLLVTSPGITQSKFQSESVNIQLAGTSSIHDWTETSDKGTGNAVFAVNSNDKVISLSAMSFTLAAVSLKSGHKAMDKNTYKALKTDAHPNISFVLTSAKITPLEDDNYEIKCNGKLTIAGATNNTEITGTGKYNRAEKSFTVKGTKKMKMTDYQVKPPTVMLGAIKTGNDITISYTIKFVK